MNENHTWIFELYKRELKSSFCKFQAMFKKKETCNSDLLDLVQSRKKFFENNEFQDSANQTD